MIHFIPLSRFSYRVYGSPAEVEGRLKELVRPRLLWRKSFLSKREDGPPFHGVIENAQFKFRRVIYYRNSYLPVISGRITDDLGSVTVSGRMHPHWLVLLLSFGFIAIFITSFFLPFFANDNVEQLRPMLAPIAGMLFLFYIAIMAFFNYEAHKAAALLDAHFKGGSEL